MAKVLVFLDSAAPAALIEALRPALQKHFAARAHTCVQLMQAHPNDVFFVAPDGYTRPQAVVEVSVSPGTILADCYASMAAALRGLPMLSSSLVFVVQERRFIDCAPQPVHYHYLMVKRADFTVADYNDYYSNYHCRMGLHTPAIAGYSQNYVDLDASQALAQQLGLGCREVTSISELKMPSLEALAAAPGLAAIAAPAAADEARFVDRERSVSFASEVVLRIGDFTTLADAAFEQHFS